MGRSNPYQRSASIWGGIVHVHMILGHAAQAAGDARIAFHYARLTLEYEKESCTVGGPIWRRRSDT